MNFFRNRKKIIISSLIALGFFSVFVNYSYADIGDIGHWRDSAGGQIPGTTFSAHSFATEIQNDGIYSKPNAQTIQINEDGDYLIIASMRDNDNSNGRYNAQARITRAGTGELFTSHYSGYNRDTSEDQTWTKAVGVLIGATSGTSVQVQKRRDTDAPTGGGVVNRSDVQIVRINPENYGIYGIGGSNNLYGGTTPNTVSFDSVIAESDTSSIEANLGTNTLTLKEDNRLYLLAWSTSFAANTGGSRTQRVGHLEYDGVDELPTRSYCYRRNNVNEYCGLGSMDVIEVGTTDREVQVEVFRGPGNGADQGGANIDSTPRTDGLGQFIALELPESVEVFRSHDSAGLQNLSNDATLNVARDVDYNYSYSFSKASNTEVDVFHPTDFFTWANIWTARQDVASGRRQTSFGSITINGALQTTGEHGNYSRGNQATTDTFAMSYHPGGIFTTATSGDDVGVRSSQLAGGEAGGVDRTQPNTLGFFMLDLQTLIAPLFEQQSYRFFANIDSADVGSALAALNTDATLSSSGEEFRLRTLIHVEDNKLRHQAEDFKLQFAEKVGACDTSFSGESYSDVTASSAISFNDNAFVSDGDALTANASDPINGLNVIVGHSYEEANPFVGLSSNVQIGQDGKWDFSLRDNSAAPDTSYCFRIVRDDNTLLDTYTFIPELTTAPPPPDFCPSPLTTFPYNEGFEGGAFGAWTQNTDDDNDWENITGTTPSGGTGTAGPIEGTRYIYVEASSNVSPPGNPNRRSILTSPCFELSNVNPSEFRFQYNMEGTAPMGTFDIEVSTNGISWNSLFTRNSDQGAAWQNEILDLSSFQGQQIRLRLNRFVATNWRADVLVDDIEIREVPLGTAASNPFTSLTQAYNTVTVDGTYFFNLNGQEFRTFVNSDGWVLVASGESTTTETSYSQVNSLSLQSDNILNSSIVAEMTETTELRIDATSGPNIPFDVTSSHPTVLSRFLSYDTLIHDPNTLPMNTAFSGVDTDNVLAPVSACNGGSQSLDLKIMHNCGNAGGIHWVQSQSREEVRFGNGGNDINLWVRAAVVAHELNFSITNNDIGFGEVNTISSKYATFNSLGSLTEVVASIVDASTNATNGYEIEMDSTDFECQNCDAPGHILNPIGAVATPPSASTEQYGMKITSVGTGASQAPYDTVNFAFDTSSLPALVASGTNDNTNTEHQLYYLLDVDPLTPAGDYEMTATFTMHATF